MNDDGLRALAVAVLVSAFDDRKNRADTLRRSAERFFADRDFEGWCALAGIEPDVITRCLARLEAAGQASEGGRGDTAPPAPLVASAPAWLAGDGQKRETQNAG